MIYDHDRCHERWRAIKSIHSVLDGEEWDSSTTALIADIITNIGLKVHAPDAIKEYTIDLGSFTFECRPDEFEERLAQALQDPTNIEVVLILDEWMDDE